MTKNIDPHSLPSVKVIALGSSSVGKTSLILRFYKSIFDEENQPTIGAAYISKVIETSRGLIELHIWDTAGQERFKSIIPMYMRGCSAIFIVCSGDSLTSIESLDTWKEFLEKNREETKPIFVVLNKIDLLNDNEKSNLAKLWAEKNQFFYFETSAKLNIGINELFQKIAEEIVINTPISVIPESLPKLENKPNKSKDCC